MTRGKPNVRISFGGPLTPVVRTLIWINGLVWFFLFLVEGKIYSPTGEPYMSVVVSLLGLSPSAVLHDMALWQPITYLFVHLAFFHVGFNMLGLWWFGTDLERTWGSQKFLRYYLFTGVGAGLVSVCFNIPTIGASGAIYGVLLGFGLLFPNRVLYLYFVVPVKAKYMVIFFGVVELFFVIKGGQGGVNNVAHLSGILFGLLWIGFSRWNFQLANIIKVLRRTRAKRRLRLIRKEPGGDDDSSSSYDNHTIH